MSAKVISLETNLRENPDGGYSHSLSPLRQRELLAKFVEPARSYAFLAVKARPESVKRIAMEFGTFFYGYHLHGKYVEGFSAYLQRSGVRNVSYPLVDCSGSSSTERHSSWINWPVFFVVQKGDKKKFLQKLSLKENPKFHELLLAMEKPQDYHTKQITWIKQEGIEPLIAEEAGTFDGKTLLSAVNVLAGFSYECYRRGLEPLEDD